MGHTCSKSVSIVELHHPNPDSNKNSESHIESKSNSQTQEQEHSTITSESTEPELTTTVCEKASEDTSDKSNTDVKLDTIESEKDIHIETQTKIIFMKKPMHHHVTDLNKSDCEDFVCVLVGIISVWAIITCIYVLISR